MGRLLLAISGRRHDIPDASVVLSGRMLRVLISGYDAERSNPSFSVKFSNREPLIVRRKPGVCGFRRLKKSPYGTDALFGAK